MRSVNFLLIIVAVVILCSQGDAAEHSATTLKLANHSTLVGTSQTLTCETSVKGYPAYIFYHNGKQIQTGKSNKLVLSYVGSSDAGNYQCRATSRGNNYDSNIAKMVIQVQTPGKPKLTAVHPESVKGTTQILVCEASGQRRYNYIFYHNGKIVQSDKGNRLTMPDIGSAHEGNYQCRVTFNGKNYDSNIYKVVIETATKPLAVTLIPSKKTPRVGRYLTLTCNASRPGDLNYIFYHDGRQVQAGHGPKFDLRELETFDKGNYLCIATLDGRQYNSSIYKIDFRSKGKSPGKISLVPAIKDLSSGDSQTLTCMVTTPGAWIYVFYHDGKKVQSSKGRDLILKNVVESQTGTYGCSVTSGGEQYKSANIYKLTIKKTPGKVTLVPSKKELTVGDTQTMACYTTSSGSYQYTFYYNGKEVQSGKSNELVLKEVKLSQAGDYQCRVVSEGKQYDSNKYKLVVKVTGPGKLTLKPSKLALINGDSQTLTCLTSTNGSYDYTFYHNEKEVQSIKSNMLVLENVGVAQTGNYQCRVTYQGKHYASDIYRLVIKFSNPGTITLVPSEASPHHGDNQTLTCRTSVQGAWQYTFYHNGKEVKSDKSDSLVLTELCEKQAGNYQCRVTSEGKKYDSNVYKLIMETVSVHQPTLKPANPNTTMPAGLDQVLTCETEDKGDLLFKFLKDDKLIQDGKEPKLVLQNLSPADSAKYECYVTMRGHHDSSHSNAYELVVEVSRERPDLTCSCPSSHVWLHSSLTLNCGAKVVPGVTYHFYKDDIAIHNGRSNQFTMSNVLAKDAGIYTCTTMHHGKQSEHSNTFPIEVMEKCNAHIDLLFLVDTSSSMIPGSLKIAKEFIQKIVAKFDVSPDVVRVSTVLFANGPHNGFCLDKYTTNLALNKGIGGLACPACKKGKKSLAAALKYGREKTFSYSCGSRDDAIKIVVVLIDGKTTDDEMLLSDEAEEMKMVADEVMIIGAGKTDKDELEMIATKDENVFTIKDLSKTQSIIDTVAIKTCEAGAAWYGLEGDNWDEEDWDAEDVDFDGDWDDSDELDWEWE